MRTPLTLLAAVVVLLLGLGARGVLASGLQVAAPGRLTAQTVPVTLSHCWTGTITLTPTQASGNPQRYRKVAVAGASGAFSKCIGQYADLSVNQGSTQLDFERNYQLAGNDGAGFTLTLSKGALTVPVPTGTTYTLVIHP